jgi:hypothetical protein
VPPEWISNKKVNPVVKFTPLPIPGLAADVPFVGDLIRSREAKDILNVLTAPDALGRPFIASKQVPANRLAIIRAAFDHAMKDPQFLADAQRLDLPVSGSTQGSEAETIVASIYAASPALIARAQEMMGK